MSKLIGEAERNNKEKIKVSIEEYKGHTFVDCRIYWDDNGTWRPSKKGITFNGECIDEVITMLQRASRALEG